VAEALGVAGRAAFFLSEILKGAFDEVTVRGMHGHDALRDALEQFDGVVAGDGGVAGVVVHAKAVGG